MNAIRQKDVQRDALNAERIAELGGIVLAQAARIAELEAQVQTLTKQLEDQAQKKKSGQ